MAKSKIVPDHEIARMVLDAGFTGLAAPVMVAVCLAESGGDAYAINVVDRDPAAVTYLSLDVGICQINSFWHQQSISIAEMLDPAKAIRWAKELAWDDAKGRWDFTPWVVFESLRFLEYWERAVAAVRLTQPA